MEEATQAFSNSNQLNTNYSVAQLLLGFDNKFEPYDYTNSAGTSKTIARGTVMGRVNASGKILPLVAAASDGSQFPIGILCENVTVIAGATTNLSLCVSGGVAKELIVFDNGTDTFASVVDGQRLDTLIGANTVGVKMYGTDNLTGFDNQ
jgi:hypothetical protein